MSASPDFMQSLLGSLTPWMTGASPSALDQGASQYGGFNGLLGALMQGSGPDTTQARQGAALERARTNALDQAQKRQNLAMGAMGMQQTAQMMPFLMNAMQSLSGGASGGVPSGQSQPGAQADQPSAQGAAPQQGPQGGGPQSPGYAGALANLQMGGLMDLMGRNGSGFTNIGNFIAQNDPSMLTSKKVAENELTQDMALYSQAVKSGNQLGAQAAYLKYLKDSGMVTVDRYGNVTTLGGINPSQLGVNTFLPAQGIQTSGGVASPIPGILPSRESLAGAEARGKAQGDVEQVTDGNGNKYFVPRSTLLGGAGGAAGASSGSPGAASTPFAASLGPASSELLKGKGEQAAEVNKDFQGKAEAAQQMLAQIAELRSAANDFTPGQFAESRMKMLQYLQSAGLLTKEQANSLGSAQAGQKIAIQLQAAATKQLGSREAAQVFQIMGKSLPNLTLSPDGLNKVSSYMEGLARYDIARAQLAQHYTQENDVNGLNGVRNEFIQKTNPSYYIFASADPKTQAEMIRAMGPAAQKFLKDWNAAANAGWAPRPGEYHGGS